MAAILPGFFEFFPVFDCNDPVLGSSLHTTCFIYLRATTKTGMLVAFTSPRCQALNPVTSRFSFCFTLKRRSLTLVSFPRTRLSLLIESGKSSNNKSLSRKEDKCNNNNFNNSSSSCLPQEQMYQVG